MVSETLVRDSLLWSRFEIRCLHRRFGAASAAVAPIGIAGSFASGYACARFVGEVFREPDGIVYGPITMGMAYCMPMAIIGACLIVLAMRRNVISES